MISLGGAQKLKRIPLNEISEGENVRKVYAGIDELAASIERDGQLQPIGVCINGFEGFRVLYGHRRLRAHKLLTDQGKPDFAAISAVVMEEPRSIEAVQLIENIQRDDLSDADKEQAVKAMVEREKLSQREVARLLSKSESWVSRVLSAGQLRDTVEAQGVAASSVGTAALSELVSVPEEKKAEAVAAVVQAGGTVQAAREVKRDMVPRSSGGLPTVEASNGKWLRDADGKKTLGERIMAVCAEYREKASDMALKGAPELGKMVLEIVERLEKEVEK